MKIGNKLKTPLFILAPIAPAQKQLTRKKPIIMVRGSKKMMIMHNSMIPSQTALSCNPDSDRSKQYGTERIFKIESSPISMDGIQKKLIFIFSSNSIVL
jgi:hypothetical protein